MPEINKKFLKNISDLDLLKLYGESILDCLHSNYDKKILVESAAKFIEQIRNCFEKEQFARKILERELQDLRNSL